MTNDDQTPVNLGLAVGACGVLTLSLQQGRTGLAITVSDAQLDALSESIEEAKKRRGYAATKTLARVHL